MTHRVPGTASRVPATLVASLLVIAASAAAVGVAHRMLSSATASLPLASSTAPVTPSVPTPPTAAPPAALRGGGLGELGAPRGALPGGALPGANDALGAGDGVLASGTSVLDGRLPGITKLDGALLDALRRAARDAEREGVHVDVESGWRSRKYQEQLLRQAVADYGSEAEAARWVATPDTSPHVSGKAADIGPADAAAWLSEHGARYGLCQIYRNEPWHYELRPAAVGHGCPPTYADPAHDPRMQR
jgi:zinc D-Ala-D-Ala carboxypeptidase